MQRERGEHDDQRMVDGRLVGMHLELRKQTRADTDNDSQHQYLDARRHHVAEHLFREERGCVPERKRDQDEAGKRGQLELDQGDEKLYRQHEEAEDHHQLGDEQHHDGIEVHEHLGKARHVADLLQNRRPSVDAGLRQPARLQEVLHRDGRAGGGDAQTGERPEHDAGQPVKVADDLGEGTDVQHLAQQLGNHVLALAGGVAHGPIQASDGHVDDDQRGRQERDFALQQTETRVDVARERVEEAVDDGHVVHGASSAAASGASPSGVSSVGVSKLAGIGGSSASVR
uniref:LigA n=1 Tax=Steinernema glaseri TaxID=37863 RepID=A0A1I7Z7Z7_9BILA